MSQLHRAGGANPVASTVPPGGEALMDSKKLHARGLKLRKKMFGKAAVAKRMSAAGDFGAPLQHIINAYAYGDVWSRPQLPNKMRSLAVLGINAAINRPAEFRVHVHGALANGCTPDEIREVLLLVALYCGIPAANDAHRIAHEVFEEKAGRK
jgi:4-carboxymuconolactone decarboxylase